MTRPLLCLAAVLALSGCASPDPTYYTLDPVPGTPLRASPATIEVRRPGLAGYLDRSDVVLRSAGYRLDVNSQIRWAEPLGDMIGRVLTQNLSERLPGSSVFSQGGAISADAQLRVEVDVQSFDADASGQAVLVAELVVERGATHHPISARQISLRASPGSATPAALAAALSQLLGQLADQTASDIAVAAPGVSAAA